MPEGKQVFHEGEKRIHEALGLAELVEHQGQRMVRSFMPDQHRELFGKLPFLVLGAVDDSGHPHAGLIPGWPGFISSPDARTLAVAGRAIEGDPIAHMLEDGASVGTLGIELESRRRNRMNGRLAQVSHDGFAIRVVQSFGNCPQYIQMRDPEILEDRIRAPKARAVHRHAGLTDALRAHLERADTFFIASRSAELEGSPANGVDVSHRGGNPGFIRVDGSNCFVFPDFRGNKHFNTFGNIVEDARVGILVPDFANGDLVTLTGTAEILWADPEVSAFQGAERLVKVSITSIVHLEDALPFRWSDPIFSRSLNSTGSWAEAGYR